MKKVPVLSIARSAAVFAIVLGAGTAGCQCSKPESTRQAISEEAVARAIGTAQRIASGDLDGDRQPELVMVDAQSLRVSDLTGRELARQPVTGGVQVLRVADVDGDGRAEVIAGWGQSREHQGAKARISIYRLTADTLVEEVVAEPSTSRNEVVEVLPVTGSSPPELLVAHFDSKYMVRIVRAHLRGGRWALAPVDAIRMATSYALGDVDGDGMTDLIVGRTYGDDVDAEGDAFVLRPDGSRVPIPVTGGVRSLNVADLDADGRLEVLVGDGWNKNYGQLARARLTRAWWDHGAFRSELVEESPGQYTLWNILVTNVDGDGQRQIVTRGSAHVRVLSRKGDGWEGRVVGSGCHDLALLELDPRRGDDRLLAACKEGSKVLLP